MLWFIKLFTKIFALINHSFCILILIIQLVCKYKRSAKKLAILNWLPLLFDIWLLCHKTRWFAVFGMLLENYIFFIRNGNHFCQIMNKSLARFGKKRFISFKNLICYHLKTFIINSWHYIVKKYVLFISLRTTFLIQNLKNER